MDWSYLDIVLFIIGLAIPTYYVARWWNNYYRGTDVKYIEPIIPFFASMFQTFIGLEHVQTFVQRSYEKYPNERYIGLFDTSRPNIMVRDVELIKQIGIKEFDSFHDHRGFIDEKADPMFGRNLFSLKGNSWRDMRATLSPAFSSSKMRKMFIYIEECAKDIADFYLKECENQGKKEIEIEVKDCFSRYTVDAIATSAYGIKVNSLKDKNNEFFTLGKLAVDFSFSQLLGVVLYTMSPKLSKILNLTLIRADVSNFFRNAVYSMMKNRKDKNIIRYDMIHLLMEAKKGSLVHDSDTKETKETGFSTVQESSIGKKTVKRDWSDDDLVAQALIFFIGGFDTTSSLVAFFFYEVSKNPEIMKRLKDEIDNFVAESGDKLMYDDVPKLKYLDMCVSESLRMWTPASIVDRVCTKPFTLPPPNEKSDKSYVVENNVSILIPIYGIHYDEKYYPNPTKFDPERFSEENKSSINPGAYLPFGIGPRNCIGSRYALIVAKAVIFHVVANFDITLSKKTNDPLVLVNSPFNLLAKDGIWINMKPNKKVNKIAKE